MVVISVGKSILSTVQRSPASLLAAVMANLDGDGDMDFLGTRGKSVPYDGVYWIEQVRSRSPKNNFQRARVTDSDEISLPM